MCRLLFSKRDFLYEEVYSKDIFSRKRKGHPNGAVLRYDRYPGTDGDLCVKDRFSGRIICFGL